MFIHVIRIQIILIQNSTNEFRIQEISRLTNKKNKEDKKYAV